jgi:5-methylcytosine-specific restriction endonuclease McrA
MTRILFPINRGFREAQRLALFFRTAPDYIYQHEECNKRITQTDFHADHIVAHSNGGQTTVDNGQALCQACNQTKAAS